MAVSSGNTISASTVNSLNSSASMSATFVRGTTMEDQMGNSGEFYSHRPSGSVILSFSSAESVSFPSIIIFEKYVNGSWSQEAQITIQTSATSASYNSSGPGRYRVHTLFGTIKQGTWSVYCGQTDIQVGQKVICWDGFQSSLNKVNSGSQITATLANSGRIGGIY